MVRAKVGAHVSRRFLLWRREMLFRRVVALLVSERSRRPKPHVPTFAAPPRPIAMRCSAARALYCTWCAFSVAPQRGGARRSCHCLVGARTACPVRGAAVLEQRVRLGDAVVCCRARRADGLAPGCDARCVRRCNKQHDADGERTRTRTRTRERGRGRGRARRRCAAHSGASTPVLWCGCGEASTGCACYVLHAASCGTTLIRQHLRYKGRSWPAAGKPPDARKLYTKQHWAEVVRTRWSCKLRERCCGIPLSGSLAPTLQLLRGAGTAFDSSTGACTAFVIRRNRKKRRRSPVTVLTSGKQALSITTPSPSPYRSSGAEQGDFTAQHLGHLQAFGSLFSHQPRLSVGRDRSWGFCAFSCDHIAVLCSCEYGTQRARSTAQT